MRVMSIAAFLVPVALALDLSFAARAGEASPQAGAYDELIVGYDSDTRTVSGYFRSETGAGQFQCIFYFKGKQDSSTAKIETHFPKGHNDKILGELIFDQPAKLSISLRSEHGGCWNVRHFADKEPAQFELLHGYPWKSIRVVKSPRAYFFSGPDAPMRQKSYLVTGDGVGIRSQQNGWFEVDYTDGKKPISAWMKESDLYPID
jgi:hypothetical protein